MTPVLSRQTVSPLMAARGLRTAAELAAGKPCGTRVRYYAGCRCSECRRANTEYEKARVKARKAGEWNGLVSSARALEHVRRLRASGIGYRTLADAAKIPPSQVAKLIYGQRQQIRAATERAILQVTEACAADRAYIDATLTWRMLDELVGCGYSRARLASELLGRPVRALQLSRERVTVRNAEKVRQVWQRLRYASPADTRRAHLMLRELSEEGFNRARVIRQVEERVLRAGMGVEVVDLYSMQDERMRQVVFEAVVAVHAALLAEDA